MCRCFNYSKSTLMHCYGPEELLEGEAKFNIINANLCSNLQMDRLTNLINLERKI